MKKNFGFGLLATGLILVGCGKEGGGDSGSVSSVVTAPVEYVAAAGKAQQSAIKAVDTAALNSAVQLFYAQEGKFPKDLTELVPQYIGKVPAAPVGMKLDYDAVSGQVKVVKQ